jgi:hypothetical protein
MQKESRFRELIEEQKLSGLSIIDFCSNHGIAPSTFHYWKKKLGKKSGSKDFIPLIVKPSWVDLAGGLHNLPFFLFLTKVITLRRALTNEINIATNFDHGGSKFRLTKRTRIESNHLFSFKDTKCKWILKSSPNTILRFVSIIGFPK